MKNGHRFKRVRYVVLSFIVAATLAFASISNAFALFDMGGGDQQPSGGLVTSLFDTGMFTSDTDDTATSDGGQASSGSIFNLTTPSIDDPLTAGAAEGSVTILIYMNGSNLESDGNEGTLDLTEMVKAGDSPNVNVVVETVGTKSWNRKYHIASDRSQIYKVGGSGLQLVRDDLGQRDCTDPATLLDFIEWGTAAYPADRYMLILWDHGGGPVYGFGYDEYQPASATLSIDEIQQALRQSGVHFDFVGFDACIMGSLEVCCALYDVCDYAIVSEDFESGIGWSYTPWLKALYADPTLSTPELGKIIVDSMFSANESSFQGRNGILAVVDESAVKLLYATWIEFAYSNEATLLSQNYSIDVESNGRLHPILQDREYFQGMAEDYFITDLMALAFAVDAQGSAALESALAQAIVYMNATESDSYLTGLSVTLPYGSNKFYKELEKIFENCGFDTQYVTWLGKFVDCSGSTVQYDYGDWYSDWFGWGNYTDQYEWSDWSGESLWSDDWFGWTEEDSDSQGWLFSGWDSEEEYTGSDWWDATDYGGAGSGWGLWDLGSAQNGSDDTAESLDGWDLFGDAATSDYYGAFSFFSGESDGQSAGDSVLGLIGGLLGVGSDATTVSESDLIDFVGGLLFGNNW